ncbi:TerB family tellurite resistance protein [Idiomarina tyrosinivorans]|uniref:TerB family tellurite resistance protein n=1 Tax=Idiomarina tyrosinivorans TaxID=1445662 RepID=A0A432ZSH1_9GAMM|nr:TerB family tellurite resistance protein [Idiomarina tyrosinivorans]RUO80839.1 TerB family tellurite resistance protein [Idiomarina tyrosinivorans]
MFAALQSLLNKAKDNQASLSPLPQIDGLSEAQVQGLVLMSEMSRADNQRDGTETRWIITQLVKESGLSEQQATAAFEKASDYGEGASSLQEVTAPLKALSYPDRVQLIKQLWQTAYADGKLDPYEEAMMRQIADLLYLRHSDYIKTKLEVTGE